MWDVLAPGLDCSTVSNVRFGPAPATAPTITCTDPGSPDQPDFTGSSVSSLLRVTWELAGDVAADEIAPGERFAILYDVTVPDPADVSTVYPDTAHVRRYQQPTNVTGPVGRGGARSTPRRTSTPRCCPSCRPAPWPATARRSGCARPSWRRRARRRSPSRTTTPPTRRRSARWSPTATRSSSPPGPRSTPARWPTPCPRASCGRGRPRWPSTRTPPQPGTAAPPAGVALDPATGRVTFGPEYANDHRHRPALRGALPRPGHADGHHDGAERHGAHQHGALREPGHRGRRPADPDDRRLHGQPAPAAARPWPRRPTSPDRSPAAPS